MFPARRRRLAKRLPRLALNAPYGAVGDSWIAGSYFNNSDSSQVFGENYIVTPLMEQAQHVLRMTYKGNAAVSGQTVSQIAAQVAGMLATMTSAGLVIVEGGLNDISAGTAGATIAASLLSTTQTILNAGHRVLFIAIPPADPSNPFSGPQESARLACNAITAALRSNKRVKYFNSDNIGLVHADYSNAIHLTWPGYDKFAAPIVALLQPWLPLGDVRTVPGQEYVSNSVLAGGTTAPTGWSIDTSAAGGATVVGSKVNGKWRITISGNYSGSSRVVTMMQIVNPVSPPPVTGDFVEALASYTMQATPTNVRAPSARFNLFTSGFANLGQGSGSFPTAGAGGEGPLPTSRASGTYVSRTPQTKVASGTVAISQCWAEIGFPDAVSSTPCAATIDFDFITLRKVV